MKRLLNMFEFVSYINEFSIIDLYNMHLSHKMMLQLSVTWY